MAKRTPKADHEETPVRAGALFPFLAPGPECGQRLGPFTLRRLLAPGEYGVSFEAEETATGRAVVLKVAPAFGRGPRLLQQLEREFQDTVGADHLLTPGDPWLVPSGGLEWVLIPTARATESFRTWLLETAADTAGRRKEGLALFRQACLGLAALHWRGRPHLALKPENLLLCETPGGPRLKLADFYQGRLLRRLGWGDPMTRWSPSAPPYYRAPELISAPRPRGVGPAADLYAMGAILFELLDGDPPFEGTPESLEWLHQNMEPPEALGEAPEYLKALATRCLEKRPGDRPAGAAELGLLLSCDPEETGAFREAEGEGSVRAWRAFLERFPEGNRRAEAEAALAAAERAPKPPPPEPAAPPPVPVPAPAPPPSEALGPLPDERAEQAPSLPRDGSPHFRDPLGGLDYLWVSAGEYGMGGRLGDAKAGANERPRHRVQITRGFWLCSTPVTVRSYRLFCEKTGRRMPAPSLANPAWSGLDHPMVSVTWEEAAAYCAWVEGRLPTEAEWEYAARAATDLKYWWGEEMDGGCAWYVENAAKRTHPVGEKRPNPWGFHEVLGHVWEWCEDWYGQEYYRDSPVQDPKGPESGVFKSLRGGSFQNFAWNLRASIRNRNIPTYRGDNNGFRPVLLRPAP